MITIGVNTLSDGVMRKQVLIQIKF